MGTNDVDESMKDWMVVKFFSKSINKNKRARTYS